MTTLIPDDSVLQLTTYLLNYNACIYAMKYYYHIIEAVIFLLPHYY